VLQSNVGSWGAGAAPWSLGEWRSTTAMSAATAGSASDPVGMLRIHRASGGGGGSAQAKEGMVDLPLAVTPVAGRPALRPAREGPAGGGCVLRQRSRQRAPGVRASEMRPAIFSLRLTAGSPKASTRLSLQIERCSTSCATDRAVQNPFQFCCGASS